jgi:putative acetyltransferase
MITIDRESPLGADLHLLMARHTADMHADTPPESIHMMDAGALGAPGIEFFVMRDTGVPVAMGAFKRIDATHAEIKSMHVLAEQRGLGLAARMLDHLMAEAKAAGFARLSLYARAGFAECGPFEGYGPDPNSVFMTRHV